MRSVNAVTIDRDVDAIGCGVGLGRLPNWNRLTWNSACYRHQSAVAGTNDTIMSTTNMATMNHLP